MIKINLLQEILWKNKRLIKFAVLYMGTKRCRRQGSLKIKMMFELENHGLLSNAIGIISELVNEVKFKLNKEGLEVIAIDPANVALIVFKLPVSVFSQYDVKTEKVLGINLEDLKKVLRRGAGKLKAESKENKLHLEFSGERKKGFVLSLINIDEEEREVPELDFGVGFEVGAEVLADAIEDAGSVSDSVDFIAAGGSFSLNSESSLHSANIDIAKIASKENAQARYSLEYLQKMVKAAKLADKVSVQFGKDYPLKLDYSGDVQMSFILAPRVEKD